MGKKEIIDIDTMNISLDAIAVKIRAMTGKTDPLVFPEDFIESTNLSSIVSQSELDSYLAAMVNKTIAVLDNDKITRIPGGNFQKGNTNLTTVNLPNVTFLPEGSFSSCSNLINLNLPKVTSLGGGALAMLRSIPSLYLPSLTTMDSWGWTFQGLTKCSRIYFPKLTKNIGSNDFNGCSILTTFILGSPTMCVLTAPTTAFKGTPIAKGTGYIYVPKALEEAYKTDTNWSTFASQIRAIEDYPEVLDGWE